MFIISLSSSPFSLYMYTNKRNVNCYGILFLNFSHKFSQALLAIKIFLNIVHIIVAFIMSQNLCRKQSDVFSPVLQRKYTCKFAPEKWAVGRVRLLICKCCAYIAHIYPTSCFTRVGRDLLLILSLRAPVPSLSTRQWQNLVSLAFRGKSSQRSESLSLGAFVVYWRRRAAEGEIAGK